jgi:hypothetical protein
MAAPSPPEPADQNRGRIDTDRAATVLMLEEQRVEAAVARHAQREVLGVAGRAGEGGGRALALGRVGEPQP